MNYLLSITVFDIVKWFFVVGLVMYAAFAAVITRQVKVMNESVEDPFNLVISLVAVVHLLLAILLIVAAVTLL